MPETHVRRRSALRALLRVRELDALLVVDLRNVRYLTGFTGSSAALVVHAEDDASTVFATDGRYLTQSERQVPDLERLVARPTLSELATLLGEHAKRYARTGYESHRVTVDDLEMLAEKVGDVALSRAPGLVEELRIVKDDTEIEALRMACAAADRALADLIEHGGLRAGRTEREVAHELANRMLDHGAEASSFDSIVATGPNSAVPHHRPSDAELRVGDLIKLDFGALVDGYHSDMTRTFALGRPADWQRELYDLVATAQAAGRAALRPGAELKAVDTAAREVIEAAGRGEEFLHGLGHGVGLEIHEAPFMAKTSDGTLSAGMAVTVEPGVYLSGKGGVRIEDTLVVRDGDPELLTLTTKQLVVI